MSERPDRGNQTFLAIDAWLPELLERKTEFGDHLYSNQEIADFLAAGLITCGYDQRQLPPLAQRLMLQFADRAGVEPGASKEETEAVINAYFSANPLHPDLLYHFRHNLRFDAIEGSLQDDVDAFDVCLGNIPRNLVQEEPPLDAVKGGPLARFLALEKVDK